MKCEPLSSSTQEVEMPAAASSPPQPVPESDARRTASGSSTQHDNKGFSTASSPSDRVGATSPPPPSDATIQPEGTKTEDSTRQQQEQRASAESTTTTATTASAEKPKKKKRESWWRKLKRLAREHGMALVFYYLLVDEVLVLLITALLHYDYLGAGDVIAWLKWGGLERFVGNLDDISSKSVVLGPLEISAKFVLNYTIAEGLVTPLTGFELPFCIATLPYFKRGVARLAFWRRASVSPSSTTAATGTTAASSTTAATSNGTSSRAAASASVTTP